MVRQGVELNARPHHVVRSLKGVFDVKIAVAVVAVGTQKHDSFCRQIVNELVAQGSAVGSSPLRQSPAVVDDQPLAVFLRHVVHPFERIERSRLVNHEGCKQQFGRWRHSRQSDARATASRNACHVRTMSGVAVHVGRVAAQTLDVPRRIGRHPVIEPTWRRTSLTVLIPHRANSGGGQGGVVKHRVGVVKSPVEHPEEHPLALKRLRQVVPYVNAVDAGAISGSVQVWDGTRRQFHPVHGQGCQQVQVVHVHTERATP